MVENEENIERVSVNHVTYARPPDDPPTLEPLAQTENYLLENNLEGPKYVMKEILTTEYCFREQ